MRSAVTSVTNPDAAGRLGSEMRRLPYGANYLAWDDMSELEETIQGKTLFRYQTPGTSMADRLERIVGKRFKVPHALAIHNCTEGLRLSLLATRPRVGDLVYIPAVTFVAVAGAVLSCGLIPVLVDVDEDFHLDPADLPLDAVRVVVAHMEGLVGRLPARPLFVIEDAAQALGGHHEDGSYAGTTGWSGVFSFHHNKVLTSGEGGIVVTRDASAWECMRMYHDHGCERIQGEYPRWTEDAHYGENFVTSEAIAAIECQQFRHLDEILEGLWRGYGILLETLAGTRSDLVVRERRAGDVPISVRIACATSGLRDRVVERLRSRGLPYWTLDRYFLPDHPVLKGRHSLYADGFPWNLAPGAAEPRRFPKTLERLRRVVCLPISPELTEHDQVAEARAFRSALDDL